MRSLRVSPVFILAIILLVSSIQIAMTAQLWPSVKTSNRIAATQDNIDWLAAHYDWMDSAPSPVENWLAHNPYIIADKYFHWLILNVVNDPPSGPVGSSHSEMTMRWYSYCALNNLDWEQGFFHLSTQDTYIAQSLSGYGEYADAKIRYLYRNSSTTRYADPAWSGTASLSLAALNDSLYFGRLDRFDEVNLEFLTFASADWHGVWEYWNGSSWTALTLTGDTTNDAQQNGQVRFSPPPTKEQWKRSKVNALPTYWGDSGVYFVRLRTTAVGTTGPVVKKAQGRHYWIHNGTSGNTVPAWDPANDTNGDGYAESAVNPNATARFKYEARLPHFWAWVQSALNVSNPAMRQKYPSLSLEMLQAQATPTYKYYGAQLDDMSACNLPTAALEGKVLEYPGMTSTQVKDQWLADVEEMLIYGHQVLNSNGYLLGANVGWKGLETINQHLDYHVREDASGAGGCNRTSTPGYWGNWEENMWPAGSQWQKWGDLGRPMLLQWQLAMYYQMGEQGKTVNLVNGSDQVSGNGTLWSKTAQPGSILTFSISGTDYFAEVKTVNSDTSLTLTQAWSGSTLSNQWHTMLTARDKYLGLAAFLTLQKPETDYFSTWWGYYYGGHKSPYFNWIDAAKADYGTPTGVIPAGKQARGTRGAYLFQSGPDPSVPTKNYYIYARDYTRALVLFRPLTGGGSYYSTSAVTVTLPEPMRLADYWGNPGLLTTQITLRGAEGAILMKESPLTTPSVEQTNPADLSAQKPGVISHRFVVSNPGATVKTDTTLSDSMSPAYTFRSAAVDGVALTPDRITLAPDPLKPGNRLLTLNIGDIPPGGSVTVTVEVELQ